MAIKVATYKWFKYQGREVLYGTGHPDHELHLFPGEIFGYKKFKDKHFVVDKTNLDVRFELKEREINRVIANSNGWTGKVDKVTVKAGVGGKDKPVTAEDTSDFHHMEIDSSNLKAAVYDKKQKILTVEFHNGAVWSYLNVTPKEARDMEEGKGFDGSQGRYFIYKIRERKQQHKETAMPTPEHRAKAPAAAEPAKEVKPKAESKTVKFKLKKAEFDAWLDAEQVNFDATKEANQDKTVYAIARRQRIDSDKEMVQVLTALNEMYASRKKIVDAHNKTVMKGIAAKMLDIARDYPYSTSLVKRRADEQIKTLERRLARN